MSVHAYDSRWPKSREMVAAEVMMKAKLIATAAALFVVAALPTAHSVAQTVVNTDFSKGDIAAQGWKAKGAWDVFRYEIAAAKNPGPVARFAANKPDGSLSKTFEEVKNPKTLS